MAFDRTTIKSGPAILTWNGGTIYFAGGLTIEESYEIFDVRADIFAGADKRRGSLLATIKGKPSGQWTNLSVWFPWLSAARGARAHGASDKAAVVKFLDGDVFTYHNAALVQMPDLMLSPLKTILDGEIVLECRTKNNTAPTASASFVTRSSSSFSDTSFDWDDIPTQVYALSWGTSPWDAFHTREGVKISARPSWNDLVVDDLGIVDKELDNLEVSASFTPVGIAQSGIDAKLKLQNDASAALGSRLSANAADFIAEGSGVYVLIRNAIGRRIPIMAKTDGSGRFGEMEAVASLGITTGAAVAQLFVGTEAPA